MLISRKNSVRNKRGGGVECKQSASVVLQRFYFRNQRLNVEKSGKWKAWKRGKYSFYIRAGVGRFIFKNPATPYQERQVLDEGASSLFLSLLFRSLSLFLHVSPSSIYIFTFSTPSLSLTNFPPPPHLKLFLMPLPHLPPHSTSTPKEEPAL